MSRRATRLTARELRFLRSLRPAWRIQRWLDSIEYDIEGKGCRSPRRVMRERQAQCMDGAMFAAAALRAQGRAPLVVDLEAVMDDDHVIAVFRERGGWGAIARSNYSGLRYRDPVYPSLRALVLSYFEHYFNLRRQKTLRRFSRPVDLRRFDPIDWMTSERDLWDIPAYLVDIPHVELIDARGAGRLAPVDRRMFAAGCVGRVTR